MTDQPDSIDWDALTDPAAHRLIGPVPYKPPAYEMLDYWAEVAARAKRHLAALNASVCHWRWDLSNDPEAYACNHGLRVYGQPLDAGTGKLGLDLAAAHWRHMHPQRRLKW